MRRNLSFYLFTLIVFGVGIYFVLHHGTQLDHVAAATAASGGGEGWSRFKDSLNHPLSMLLLQMIVIILAARALGAVFRRIGQPAVTGEIMAGILLGPSLLGLALPETQAFLFPQESLGALKLFSQIGVILFMFVVGIELDLQHLRRKAQAAVLVSHASIIVPFFLGVSLALVLYRQFAPEAISFMAFALFMGSAMSITAFPVLARIIEERGLARTPLGTLAIACAAVDDATAWCILAVVVAVVQADGWMSAASTIFLALAFIAVMLLVVRPLAARIMREDDCMDAGGRAKPGAFADDCMDAGGRAKPGAFAGAGQETHSQGLVAGVLVFVFIAALFTEVIGIHALFGAFIAGVVLPSHSRLRTFLRERLETFSAAFLLPLFFAYTGLRTQIGLLDDVASWLMCALVIGVAIAGKLGGSMLAARWTGMAWKEAFALGALMNTRGLIELIVLNIGYDLGILSPRIFTMMVIMALVTTFMTGPLLTLLGYNMRAADRTRSGAPQNRV